MASLHPRSKAIGKKITSENSLVSWVREMKERERSRHRQTWIDWINVLVAFHNRSDLRCADDFRLSSRLSNRDEKQLREITVNYVQPHIRTVAAKLQKARPILECIPATTDEVDIQAAKIGDKLLRAEWQRQRLDIVRIENAIWTGSTGNGFIHLFFDREDGEVTPDGVPIGNLTSETANPFKVLFEPHRNDVSRCRWAIYTQRMPIDHMQAAYEAVYRQRTGEELVLSASDTVNSGGDEVTSGYLSMIGMTDSSAGGLDDSDSIDVDILYHVPTAQYPKGIYAIIAGSKVLYVGRYPYPFLGRLPFLHFREILCPWRLYGDTGTIAVLNQQADYHELRTMEKDYHRSNLAAKWLRPKGCRMNTHAALSKRNEVVDYVARQGQKPERLPGIAVPGSIYQSINLSREELQRSSGVNEASQGVMPTGVSSGRALLALQEQDDTRLSMTVQLAETEYAAWGKMMLQMAREFYDEPRRYAIVGDTLAGGMWMFDKADLGSTNDVVCVPGTALPQNKIAKQQAVLELFQAGIYGQPQDPAVAARVRRMLDIGGQNEDARDEDLLQEQVATKENTWMLSTMQTMPIAPIDDHNVHMRIHRKRALSAGVRDEPQVLAILLAHMQMHDQALNPPPAPQPPAPAPGPQPGAVPPNPEILARPPAPGGGPIATDQVVTPQEVSGGAPQA